VEVGEVGGGGISKAIYSNLFKEGNYEARLEIPVETLWVQTKKNHPWRI